MTTEIFSNNTGSYGNMCKLEKTVVQIRKLINLWMEEGRESRAHVGREERTGCTEEARRKRSAKGRRCRVPWWGSGNAPCMAATIIIRGWYPALGRGYFEREGVRASLHSPRWRAVQTIRFKWQNCEMINLWLGKWEVSGLSKWHGQMRVSPCCGCSNRIQDRSLGSIK